MLQGEEPLFDVTLASIEGVSFIEKGEELNAGQLPTELLVFYDHDDSQAVEQIGKLRNQLPDLRVAVVSERCDEEGVYEALSTGIDAYLVKPVSKDQFQSALREINAGGSPMSPPISRMLMRSFRKEGRGLVEFGLSGREMEVLAALADGLAYKQIASELQMGMGTVRTHIRHLYKKLGVHSRTEAVVKYLGAQ